MRKTFNLLLIVLFFGFIFSPSIALLVTEQSTWSEAEKRSLAPPPSIPAHPGQAADFFAAADDYFNDHFGFREFYIRRYQIELDKRFDGFNVINSTSALIKGLGGWYYFNKFNLIDDFFGYIPLTDKQLQAWLASLQEKHDWLQERNIRYLYFVAPNKQSIYPEYLMKHSLAMKGTSRFEQLLNFTGNHFPDYMINLHSLLKKEASDKQLYYKNDSHWNQLGAYIAFQKVFEKLAEWFPDEEFITDFPFGADETGLGGNSGIGGDLAQMLMQPELTETYPQVKRFKSCATYVHYPYQISNLIKGGGRDSFMKSCPSKNLRAVIFRDSFFVALEPFFSENFKEVIYLWKGFDRQNMEEILLHFKPDIVIEAGVEREIFNALPDAEKPTHTLPTGRTKN